MVYKNHFWPLTLHHLIAILWFEAGKFVYLFFLDGSSVRGLSEVLALLPQFKKKRKIIQSKRRIDAAEMGECLRTL